MAGECGRTHAPLSLTARPFRERTHTPSAVADRAPIPPYHAQFGPISLLCCFIHEAVSVEDASDAKVKAHWALFVLSLFALLLVLALCYLLALRYLLAVLALRAVLSLLALL